MTVDGGHFHVDLLWQQFENNADLVEADDRDRTPVASDGVDGCSEARLVLAIQGHVVKDRPLRARNRKDGRISTSPDRDMVGVPVRAVWPPADHHIRTDSPDLACDSIGYLSAIALRHGAVRIVPQFDGSKSKEAGRPAQLFAADLGELLGAPRRPIQPTSPAARCTDKVNRYVGAGVSGNHSPVAHRFIVGMGHHQQNRWHPPMMDRPGERVVNGRALCPVLIGRDLELQALDDALRAARRGEGQAVLLAGDAGIGKSRLAHELERRAHEDRMKSLWGGCTPADVALPYLPFVEAIGSYLASADLDWLGSRLGPGRLALAPLFPQFDPTPERVAITSPAESKLRLFEAILALFQVAAGSRGLLVVLEDLHWADASSCELLGYLARRLRRTRILILVTYRGEELVSAHPLSGLVRAWRNQYAADVIELGPLSAEQVGEMVRAIVPNQSIRPAFRDLLSARCEGNPFVLEEFLRHSLDRGFVFQTETQWDRRAMTDFKLPRTVRDTLLARLERLPRAHAEVAKVAAVLGSSFDYWTLVAASGRDQETVERALQSCVEHQLMEEDHRAPVRYRFRHALTHEAIYDSVGAPQRQQLHQRAAQVMQASPQTPAIDLAHHLLAAGRWQQAIPVCLLAAEEAERHLGYREAIGLYTRALAHIDDRFTRGQVLCQLGRAYAYADDPGRAWPYLMEGIPQLEESGRLREAAGFRFWLGRCFWERYRPDLARVEYERVRAMLEPDGPSEALANACVLLGALEYFQLRFNEALPLAQHAIGLAEAAHADVPRIWGTFYVAAARAGLGYLSEGLDDLARCYREAVAGGYTWLAANAAFHRSMVLCTALRGPEAMEWLALLQRLPQTAYRDRLAAFAEGAISYELGDITRSLRATEKALQLGRETDATVWIVRSRIWKARNLAARGNLDEAFASLPQDDELREGVERSWTIETRTRIFLDRQETEGAIGEAHKFLEDPGWEPSHITLRLFDVAVEALAIAGELEEARQLAARARHGRIGSQHPYLMRMMGNLALGDGDLVKAEECLALSAEAMKQAGHRLDESRTRRLLAQVHARRGDRTGAATELRQVVAYAAASGASFEAHQADELLSHLGFKVEDRVAADGSGAQPGAPLSPREREVAILVAQGLSNKQIALRLRIAERTAENHVEHILNRLSFQSRAQVAVWAAREGLV